MPKFAWEGKTRGGKVQKGEMEAPDANAVAAKLRAQEIMPVDGSIKPKAGAMSMELNIPGLQPRVKNRDLIVFTRQFATMIDAGLPLVQCLDLLATESDNKTFQKILFDVKETVESGSTFADALGRHPKTFNNLYVQMVKSGEVGGILDTILNRLAVSIEKSERLKKQIKGAMVYPAVVLTVALVVTIVLLVFVVPTFQQLFSELNFPMPKFTMMIINMSNWLIHKWGWAELLIGAGTFLALYTAINSNPKSKFQLHAFYLKIPAIGDVIKKSEVARFTRTLGTLISSGVAIMDGLEIVANTSSNLVVRKELMGIRSGIAEGKTLVEPLRDSKVFPHMVVQMIGVGEQTGALDTMLSKIADFYEEEVDDAVEALTGLMEPVMVIFLGVTVGGLAVAMYLPIFSMAGNFGNSSQEL